MKDIKIPATVIFNSINVNAIDSQSGIWTGENKQWNWCSSSKTNSGFGTAQGENNLFLELVNILADQDTIDNPVNFISDKQKSVSTYKKP